MRCWHHLQGSVERIDLRGNGRVVDLRVGLQQRDRKSTRLNSSHSSISYAVFCLKKKNCLLLSHPTETAHTFSAHHHASALSLPQRHPPNPPPHAHISDHPAAHQLHQCTPAPTSL